MRKSLMLMGLILGLAPVSVPLPAELQAAEAALPAAAEADAMKAGFEALAEPERRALQDALIWTGDYAGILSGTFGPRTREAILAYAKRTGLPANAMLDAPARGKLLASAQALRKAVDFTVVTDDHAGLSIGLPRKMMGKTTATGTGSRFSSADDAIVLDTVARPLGEGGLPEVFARMSAESDDRKVTYKLLRPDFFVVSGETADQKFYARFAAGPVGGAATVHGFALRYNKSLAKRLDPISLAIAASFEPFPSRSKDGPPQAEAQGGVPTPPSRPGGAPAAPVLAANAILVAPGLALTHLSSSACPNPSVGGRAANFKAQDGETGLALLNVPGASGAPIAIAAKAAEPGTRLFALFHAGSPGMLAAASVETGPGLEVSAPFQQGAGGAALVDGANALAGLAEANAKTPRVIAGIVLQTRYRMTEAPAIARFLGRSGIAMASPDAATQKDIDLGDASAAWRSAVAAVYCAPKL